MYRVAVFFAIFIAVAQAFVAPANRAVASPAFTRVEAPKMMMVPADNVVSNVAANANLIASTADDFGGYLFPIIGILSLGAIILYLAPPLADE
mmetsp:Transcript_9281/g.15550  ORF Transcript_9281/g.15550 Transcript_9281/m.15550 type:complete len:93 (-) Transcript_9281:162-440(-)|eukprot:CAMPEP_0116540816 /NCGR_PEP_ID=MMETSP0397-20121206/150_1 /TAXON_ID=216820 /ORGANISM="Cyclophora tenuis, Strain ECT3854" /LENGTH=92 /DNA_ID=CAMNT_0004064715 /DNA_START=65 /DNA_END=343 /DNA_ORIENTATION=-